MRIRAPELKPTAETVGLAAIIAAVLVVRIWFLDFVPIWDAGYIYHSVVAAAGRKDWAWLNQMSHISVGFMAPLALGQLVAFSSVKTYNLTVLIFQLAGILAFWQISKFLFKRNSGPLERLFLTGAFAAMPAFMAAAINPTLDLGVMVFVLLTVLFFFEQRLLPAIFSALFLASAKETGLAILGSLLCFSLIAACFSKAWRGERRFLFNLSLSFLALLLLYGLYVWYLIQQGAGEEQGSAGQLIAGIWNHTLGPAARVSKWFNWGVFWDITFSNPRVRYVLFDLGILHFNWLVLLALIGGGCAWLCRTARILLRRKEGRRTETNRHIILCLYLFVSAFIVDLVVTVGFYLCHIPRYRLPEYPFLLILGFAALRQLPISGRTRTAFWGLTFGLFVISNAFTVDPVSRAIVGTFPIGRHRMLRMVEWTKEPVFPDYGRDQLTSNLQFTALHYLLSDVLKDLHGINERPLFFMNGGAWLGPLWLDTGADIRSGDIRRAAEDLYSDVYSVYSGVLRPERFAFLSFPPFAPRDDRMVRELRKLYSLQETRVYERYGYECRLYFFGPL